MDSTRGTVMYMFYIWPVWLLSKPRSGMEGGRAALLLLQPGKQSSWGGILQTVAVWPAWYITSRGIELCPGLVLLVEGRI